MKPPKHKPKSTPRKKKGVPTPPANFRLAVLAKRLLTDMDAFHRSINWTEWWEEFFSKVASDGQYFYPSVAKFAIVKAPGAAGVNQREFINWYLGPVNDNDPLAQHFMFVKGKPLGWIEKRRSGGWWTPESMKALNRDIKCQINALDAMRAAGNGIVLSAFASIGLLLTKLDESFHGEFFIPGLELEDNIKRAEKYIGLRQRLLNMLGQAQDIYAKSHGINYSDMSGFAQLIAASALARTASGDGAKDRYQQVLDQLHSVALEKSALYGLPLPADMQSKVIESKPVEDDKPKGKIN